MRTIIEYIVKWSGPFYDGREVGRRTIHARNDPDKLVIAVRLYLAMKHQRTSSTAAQGTKVM